MVSRWTRRAAGSFVLTLVLAGFSVAREAGAGIAGGEGPAPTTHVTAPFQVYRVKPGLGLKANRDLEFLWSDTYITAFGRTLATAGPDTNDLDRLGRTIAEDHDNVFGFPATDIQLIYDYLSFDIPGFPRSLTYDTNPANPGFLQGVSPDPIADRSHVDSYVYVPRFSHNPADDYYEPNLSIPSGCYDSSVNGCNNYGTWRSGFTTNDEDLSTGGTLRHDNSLMLPGPVPSQIDDTSPARWTRGSGVASTTWNHEFQHELNYASPNFLMSEMFSTAAEILGGAPKAGKISFDVPFTYSIANCNYVGWRSLNAYLMFNFRGLDTTYAGRADDLLWRWAKGSNQYLKGLGDRLADAECAECPGKSYLAGSNGHDRLQLVYHNWRIANYVNNPTLAEGQFGFPAHFNFVPWRDIGNWRDIDTSPAANNALVIPPEVTVTRSQLKRDTTFAGMRYTPASAGGLDSTEMSIAPYASEYWVVKTAPDLHDANRNLVVRVSPTATVRSPGCGFNGRVLVSVIGYQAPAESLATWNNLWRQTQWAKTVVGPIVIDVDTVRGDAELVLPNFGQTYNAALVVISLADGVGRLHSETTYGSCGFVSLAPRVMPYTLDIGVRPSPLGPTGPVAVQSGTSTWDRSPVWAPADDEIAYVRQVSPSSQVIYRRKLDGTPPVALFTPPAPIRIYQIDWSPRGDWVAYDRSTSLYTPFDIWAYNPGTSQQRQLTSAAGMEVYPSFSRNGQQVAYWKEPTAGNWEIRRVNLDGTGDALVTTVSSAVPGRLRWSADGLRIYFLGSGLIVRSVAVSGGTITSHPEFGSPVYGLDPHVGVGGQPIVGEKTPFLNCGSSPGSPSHFSLRDLVRQTSRPYFRRSNLQAFDVSYAHDGLRVAFDWAVGAVGSVTDMDVYYASVSANRAPVFNPLSVSDLTIAACFKYTRNLAATDADGDPITYQAVMLPPGAHMLGNKFEWTPSETQVGEWYIVFRARDASGGVAQRVTKYTVTNQGGCDDPPCPNPPNCYPFEEAPVADIAGHHRFELAQNRPNPTRGPTEFQFTLPQAGPVRLELFDLSGRRVKPLAVRTFAAGPHTIHWDGRDAKGLKVGPGLYLCRIVAGANRADIKVLLVP